MPSNNTNQQKAGWGAAIAASTFMFILAMDLMILPIATNKIVNDLNTNAGMLQAAIALVSLVAAPFFITGGKLGDIFGKKKIFLIGLVLYGVGLLAAVFAPNMFVLISGWSIIKGIGMVLTIPAGLGLLIVSYPDNAQRAKAFAIYGVGIVAAPLIGPLLMGISAQLLSWRLPFALLFGLILFTIVVALRSIEETEIFEDARIDWIGTALAFVSVTLVILGAIWGGKYGWWQARRSFLIFDNQINPLGLSPTPWLIILGLMVAAILVMRLIKLESAQENSGKKQPLVSMKLFENRTYSTSWVVAVLIFVMTGAFPFIVPVFTQQALNFDSMQSAIVMIAFSLGSILLGYASGILIQRVQARLLMQISFLVIIAGIIWLIWILDVNMTASRFLLPMFIAGAGYGVVNAQIPNIQLATLAPDLLGEGSGFAETGKEIGIGLGLAVIGSIMFGLAASGFVDNVSKERDITLSMKERHEWILKMEDGAFLEESEEIISLQIPNLEQLGKKAYVEAFQLALWVLAGTMLLAFVFASLIPKNKKDKNPYQANDST